MHPSLRAVPATCQAPSSVASGCEQHLCVQDPVVLCRRSSSDGSGWNDHGQETQFDKLCESQRKKYHDPTGALSRQSPHETNHCSATGQHRTTISITAQYS
jgi:hypothetical protein